MKNYEIAEIFERLADILEFKGDNMFRINSYKKAARVIKDLTEDVEVLAKQDRLQKIPGIGSGMAEKINQYLTKGKIAKYEEIKKDVPEGLIKMLEIPSMGPKTAALVYKKLGIKNVSGFNIREQDTISITGNFRVYFLNFRTFLINSYIQTKWSVDNSTFNLPPVTHFC